jgi:hypothetical protein
MALPHQGRVPTHAERQPPCRGGQWVTPDNEELAPPPRQSLRAHPTARFQPLAEF